MNSELVAKLAELSENEEFSKKFEKAETPEAALAILAEYGVETTEEELRELVAKKNEGELTADELEDVAGGVNWVKLAKGVLQVLEGIFGK